MHEVDPVGINSLVSPPIVTDFNEHYDCTLHRSILFVRFVTIFAAEIVKQIRNRLLQLVYYDHMLETCFRLAWIAHMSFHPVEKIKHDFLLHIEVEVIKTWHDLRKRLSLVFRQFFVNDQMSNTLFKEPVNTHDQILSLFECQSKILVISCLFVLLSHV